eukprot:SAG31_NODE_2980_length_4829_cov_3.156237_3_plen_197_part_00
MFALANIFYFLFFIFYFLFFIFLFYFMRRSRHVGLDVDDESKNFLTKTDRQRKHEAEKMGMYPDPPVRTVKTAAEDPCCKVGEHGYLYDEDWDPDEEGTAANWVRGCKELFFLQRVPAALALLLCLAVASALLFGLVYGVFAQYQSIATTADGQDSEFILKLKREREKLNDWLLEEYQYYVVELHEGCQEIGDVRT